MPRFVPAEWGWSDEINFQYCVEDTSQPCDYRQGEMILLCRNEIEAEIIAEALNAFADRNELPVVFGFKNA